jgi:hypothetical protein
VLCKSVGFFTTNPTKFSWHFSIFSMIFYEFYKIQHLHLDLEETVLRAGPRISQTGPQDEKLDCNWVPGAMVGGGSSVPARGRLGSAGKGRGSAQGLTYDWFVAEVGVGAAPEVERGGGRRRLPLELLLRRAPGRGKAKGGSSSV